GQAVGQILTDTGAFLKNLDSFDYMEFSITTKDAKFMSVGTCQLIEVTFLSLCDSSIDYLGKNVGCYMLVVAHDIISVSGHDDTEINGSFAHVPAMVANRVSYHLDLQGPSVPIDTACSSSLYATHLAVQALCNGECKAAVISGAQINHRFAEWLMYLQGRILFSDGKCKPFDISADGFSQGEGMAVIILKPLETAMHDGDHVYRTILGTGVNSSGLLVSANAPAASAQREAMFRAFRASGWSPQDVDFIELHVTGTAQGDPTEVNWVAEEFKHDNKILIGSVKGNVG
ncbi:thiolase-like protein, partial [Fomes fomentarius]